MLKILFVCTGNTCRSPMAQALFKNKADEMKLDVCVSNAGLSAFPGDCASENAIEALAQADIDLSSHRSRQITVYDIDESDLIVCMTRSHKNALLPRTKEEKLIVPEKDIIDPYGMDIDTYCACRDEIKAFTDSLCEALSRPIVSPMTEADIGGIEKLEKECFSSPWTYDGILEELHNESSHFFISKLCGTLCGYIGTQTVLDECYITNVAVTASKRRLGIGKLLLDTAEKNAKRLGCSFITLEVRKSNAAAISLYEKNGFVVCGERKNFYSHPDENALIMTKYFNEKGTV